MKTLLFVLCLILAGMYIEPVEQRTAPKPSFVCTEESTEDYCDDAFKQYLNIP